MNILDFSNRLRELCDDYANQQIIFEQYRSERKMLLDQIDSVMNGVDSNYAEVEETAPGIEAEMTTHSVDITEDEPSILTGMDLGEMDNNDLEQPSERESEISSVSGLRRVSQRLNSVLGRRNPPGDENK